MAIWEQLNFQNRYSPLIEQFIFLHDHIISILIIIIILVFYILTKFLIAKNVSKKPIENHNLEILWTFLPGIILILIAFPSLRLLYLSEEREQTPFNLKTIGHQWYWSYEYSNFKNLEFDSFILNNSENFRLLEVDNYTFLPSKIPIQIYVSSTDVLHAWTIPSLGVKTDSTPGRLNSIIITSLKSGVYYGQCSEICGTNHRFIPITLNIQPLKYFKKWVNFNL